MACVAVNSLIRTLEIEFLQPYPRPIVQQMEIIPFNKDLIQSLHAKLGFLIQLFDEFRMDGVEAIKELETKLRDVAFGVEDEIELHVVHLYKEPEAFTVDVCDLYLVDPFTEADEEMGQEDSDEAKKNQYSHGIISHVLQQAIEDIDAIKEELEKVTMEYKHVIAVQGRETTLDVIPKSDDEVVKMDGSSFSNHASHTEDIMVGKNNEFDTIMKMLIQHPSKQREVVSIQGMGGIGKTTLARGVYKNPSIVSHFDRRLWVVVSQHHNKRQMLLSLLDSKDNVDNNSDEDLALSLYQSLKCQRYLVVMDDVWSKESWNDVNSCFPDDINGSRVLLTTRVAEVVTCIGSNNNYFSHQMKFLDPSESWELFHKKACKSQGVEFETIGIPIVEKCKGLPLAIVVIAGLFSKLNTLDEWKNTANALISSTSTSTLDDEECWRILSLSYSHLPHNLKACFLYLGVFPEDYKIKANNLGRLWAAEGLVKAFKNESPEAVAERYINELMDRNLILVSKRSSCGRKIKEFRVHDLLHAFCVREGQNQSLLHVAGESDSNFPQKGVRWIRVSFEYFDISALHSLSKHCRSIFYFLEWQPKDSIYLEFFSLLRVLYVTDEFHYLPSPIVPIHLRYLWLIGALHNRHDSLFSNAWNLQTYSVYGPYRVLLHLKFPQLQYIHCHGFFGAFPKSVHQNLQVISGLQASSHCDQESLLKVPYLKKVSIIMDQMNDCTKNLVCLQQLESLSVKFFSRPCEILYMRPQIINNILLLKNIRKLRFDYMKSEWKAINVLSKLPRLEVLKLSLYGVLKKWEVPENVKFCQLICLKIWYGNLKHWEVGADNFPKLERLFLNGCFELRKIPNSFAEIPALSLIQLEGCLPSAVMSAKQIQAEQHEYGNENMIVIEKYTL